MKSGETKKQRLIAATALRYVGDGSALPGVPARDLSADEAAAYEVAVLLASGLYVVAGDPATPAASEETEAGA